MNKIEIKISHPPEWPTKTIYEACQIVSRGTAPVYVENSTVLAIGQRCVRKFGLQPEEARFHDQRSMTRVLKACKGDVLLNSTGTGTIGRSCIFNADGTYIIDGHVTLLRSDPDQLDGRWLNALLQSPQGQLHLETQCYSGSTNQVELSRERLSATSIPLPSLPEQRRIAEILDTIDDVIQKTEALISKLKAMKQGLLHDLLTRGLDKNGKPRDPKAHLIPFSDVVQVNQKTELYGLNDTTNVSFIPMSDVSESGQWVIRQTRSFKDVRNGYTCFKENDILFAKITPCMENGKGGHAIGLVNGIGLGTTEFHVLRAGSEIEPRYIYYWTMTEGLRRKAEAQMTGSAGQRRVPAEFFDNFKIPLFPHSEQRKIVEILDTHDARIRTEEQYRDKLKLQKMGLMHDLLTGKVLVKV